MILLCAFLFTVAGYSYFSPTINATIDRIAYVDNDSNIQIVDSRGGNRIALTTDASTTLQRAYLFPTWSPNSQRLAFVGVGSETDPHEVALYSAPAAGGKPTRVFKSTTQIPFYLYWSPDNQWIGFLAESESKMALMLGRVDGQSDARKLESGAPLYWAWSPDSRALLLHVGGSARDSQSAQLVILPRDNPSSPQALKSEPAEFQAPHYSPDGSMQLFAATSSATDDALFLADAQGRNARSIATYRGTIAFAWSPDGKKIASLVTPEDAVLAYFGPIWISNADGSNRTKLTDENALAFYWSPDGRQIAYLTLIMPGDSTSGRGPESQLAAPMRQTEQAQLRWRVMTIADKRARTIASFVPTADFFQVLPYFDQYSRSLTFWSPDSQHLVYAQDEGNDSGSIWVADVSGSVEPRRVGDGTLAVWSWK
jgi:TolB protein